MRAILRFLKRDDAATAVEYAVLLALILGAIIAAISVLGGESGALWNNIDGDLQDQGFGA